MRLIILALIFSGCGDASWTGKSPAQGPDSCSSCYFADDPIYGEGFVCTENSGGNLPAECYGRAVMGVGE